MQVRIRCSELGRFMTDARKKGELSETCKSLMLEKYLYNTYRYKELITTDPMRKGIELEAEAIDIWQQYINDGQVRINSAGRGYAFGFNSVNDQTVQLNDKSYSFKNDFLFGTPDIITNDAVEDIKVSQKLTTFVTSDLTNGYWWQLQGYMWLTGKTKARLIYVMMSDPEWMQDAQISRLRFQVHADEIHRYEEQILHNADIAEQMPISKRCRVFDIEWDQSVMCRISDRYREAMDFYDTLNF